MSGINKVILVGHLGKDPEIRYLEGGVSVASFPLATSETFNKDGKKVWFNWVTSMLPNGNYMGVGLDITKYKNS